MRQELADPLGIVETKTPEAVDNYLGQRQGNYFGGGELGFVAVLPPMPAPVSLQPWQKPAKKPDNAITVCAGNDGPATAKARAYVRGVPPFVTDHHLDEGCGEVVFMLERHQIAGRDAQGDRLRRSRTHSTNIAEDALLIARAVELLSRISLRFQQRRLSGKAVSCQRRHGHAVLPPQKFPSAILKPRSTLLVARKNQARTARIQSALQHAVRNSKKYHSPAGPPEYSAGKTSPPPRPFFMETPNLPPCPFKATSPFRIGN